MKSFCSKIIMQMVFLLYVLDVVEVNQF